MGGGAPHTIVNASWAIGVMDPRKERRGSDINLSRSSSGWYRGSTIISIREPSREGHVFSKSGDGGSALREIFRDSAIGRQGILSGMCTHIAWSEGWGTVASGSCLRYRVYRPCITGLRGKHGSWFYSLVPMNWARVGPMTLRRWEPKLRGELGRVSLCFGWCGSAGYWGTYSLYRCTIRSCAIAVVPLLRDPLI